MNLFKRWRRSRSNEQVESAPLTATPPSATQPSAAAAGTGRSRRPATMGRTAAEQAYLAQAAHRAKQD